MGCKFSRSINKDKGVVRLDGQDIPKSKCLRYLGLISHKNGEIEHNLKFRLKAWWVKWRSVSRVWCDCRIPITSHKTSYVLWY